MQYEKLTPREIIYTNINMRNLICFAQIYAPLACAILIIIHQLTGFLVPADIGGLIIVIPPLIALILILIIWLKQK